MNTVETDNIYCVNVSRASLQRTVGVCNGATGIVVEMTFYVASDDASERSTTIVSGCDSGAAGLCETYTRS